MTETKNTDIEFLKNLIANEIGGKMNAIHAYDKMMWKVRSGFLTLIFAGWGIIIKSIIEAKTEMKTVLPYIFIFSTLSIALAIAGYKIDMNYAKRKFRIITSVNHLIPLIVKFTIEKMEVTNFEELTALLKISGDAHNDSYKGKPFNNEVIVSKILFFVPAVLIACIQIYYLI
jgi:hypothetical protein